MAPRMGMSPVWKGTKRAICCQIGITGSHCGVLYSGLDADFFLSHTILTRAKKFKILTGNLLLSVKESFAQPL
jgi:hypothetical protein